LETIPRTRPISFTKLRDVLKNPNATPEQQYEVWAQGFNAKQLGKDWILHLMDISRKGMGIVQKPAAAPKPAPQPVAEQRLLNALIRPRKPIAELSSEKLGQYKKAAGAQASAADKAGDTKKADKRFSGIVKATKKQFANDEKSVAEANPNQQIARYNPDGATYRGMANKMPTLDPRDPVHNADRFGSAHDEPYDHDDDYDKSELKRVMAKQMSNLGDQEQEILKARYWDNLTYAEIGAELRISAERVRQVEAKALRKLKHPSRADSLAAFIEESVAVEPDPKGYQKDLLTNPKNALVIDTPGDLDWYKLGQHYPTLGTDDPHEYGQGDSDMVIVPYSKQELVDLKQKLDRLKMRYKDIGGSHEQPEIHDKVEQEHIVKVKGGYELKSKHGNKNLGKYPTKAGAEKRERQVQYFKHAGESVDNKCVPVSEDVENIMGALIESILKK
jgi:RNA polymerase sigma factor (sigma-70 family)